MLTGQLGIVRAYTASTRLNIPDDSIWKYVFCIDTPSMVMKLVSSMEQMNPTVPNTRIGGKCFTVSRPALPSAVYATELANPMVGIKKATDMV